MIVSAFKILPIQTVIEPNKDGIDSKPHLRQRSSYFINNGDNYLCIRNSKRITCDTMSNGVMRIISQLDIIDRNPTFEQNV
ncbi:MAG: hypothetical protein Q8909_05660 [Bacteroidota bacterium]|nr:hypothetical protein [Bacteroidota bacterium]